MRKLYAVKQGDSFIVKRYFLSTDHGNVDIETGETVDLHPNTLTYAAAVELSDPNDAEASKR